jgi:meiotically up-regulated gene 157 (Mug157) protein
MGAMVGEEGGELAGEEEKEEVVKRLRKEKEDWEQAFKRFQKRAIDPQVNMTDKAIKALNKGDIDKVREIRNKMMKEYIRFVQTDPTVLKLVQQDDPIVKPIWVNSFKLAQDVEERERAEKKKTAGRRWLS